MSNFAERLSFVMKRENLSTVKLKKLVDISTTQIGRYLSGYYEPSLDNAIKLSTYFKCSLDYLLGLDEIPNRYGIYNKLNFEKFICRYYELLKLNNTNHNRVSIEAKFNRNNLIYWQKNKSLPTLDILYKLSIQLHVNVEYLIGRTDIRR